MTTNVDICNRALQLAEGRSSITALNDGSVEALQCNLIYTSVLEWCFSVTNWNFARKTAVLTLQKSVPTPLVTWAATYPAPPWRYQYDYPDDAARIYYVASQVQAGGLWNGKPARFAVATDVISAIQSRVILTNEVNALAVYTVQVTDPTLWPAFFTQAVVSTLAWMLTGPISGSKELIQFLEQLSEQHMTLAVTINRNEGLVIEDATPEWIQARGIAYPMRRPLTPETRQPPQEQPNASRR